MCLAVPGKIIGLDKDFAVVDMLGFESEVFIGLINNACLGDFVLVHAGCAIEKLDPCAFDYFNSLCLELLEGEDYEP
ncbi:MAG: [NiFe] hydrogenase metallocenter assembly protein HypC [Clostridia bacterium]|jgi:hydrogenase assembly chaperone HypC/HupF|nr:[NiFe] hydrogenase metallocenter assembly protein HypC [Clostridia bacterium]